MKHQHFKNKGERLLQASAEAVAVSYPADRAGVDQSGLGCSLLVSALRFLLLCCLLGVLLLGLNLLLPTSHGPQLQPAGTTGNKL